MDGARRLALDAGDLRLAGLCELELGDADRAIELLREAGPAASVDLAHALLAAGRGEEAVAALHGGGGGAGVLRARVDVARAVGRLDEALMAARQLATQHPDDVLAAVDVADLALELGHGPQAAAAFARVRAVDGSDGHAAYGWYGQAEAWAGAGRWRAALDAALGASRADRGSLTTDLLAAVTAKVFGAAGRDAPPWDEVAPRLAAARAAHRRSHEEALG